MMTRRTYPLLRGSLLALTLSLGAGCVPMWTGSDMREDIDQLQAQQKVMLESSQAEKEELTEMIASARSDVAELQDVLKEARELLQRNNANLGVEIHQTREEVERLRGQLEELDFRFARLEQDLQLFKEDVDLRFAGGGADFLDLPEEPDALLDFVSSKLNEGRPRLARKAAEKFLSKHEKHGKADEATYLLGETYFVEGHWFGAIGEYRKVLENHPRSTRRSGATLRIGESLVKLGKCTEAEVFFEIVVNDYPGSRSVRDARQHLKDLKAGSCSQ